MTAVEPTRERVAAYEHPRLGVSLETRTRTLGTVNLAVALRGRSTGWGRKTGRPRRTFFGHVAPSPAARQQGRFFVDLSIWRGPMHETVWLRSVGFHGTKSPRAERWNSERAAS